MGVLTIATETPPFADKHELGYAESRRFASPCYIDVRSPVEFAADHIPGAYNLPLFDDEQRAKIGAIYHNQPDQAFLTGMELAAPRLPWLMGELAVLRQSERPLILYCWRGGLRSQAVREAAALRGINCLRLSGGYRDYRRWVLGVLNEPLPMRVITLHGLTGCGKTAVLRLLKERHGWQSLDLEGLAQHRGSVFGHIGLTAQPPQKYFQSLLAQELSGLAAGQQLLLECESRRVGRLLLHDSLYTTLKSGLRMLRYDSPAGRARRLLGEYAPAAHLPEIKQALAAPALQAKFSAAWLKDLARQVEEGAYAEVIEYLLTHYYDPLYHYPDGPAAGYALCVESADSGAAAREIDAFIRAINS
jgi:tRNA 2-selenouridine synthase